jgi:hypothetical protein
VTYDGEAYIWNSYQHYEYTPLLNARAHQLKLGGSGGRCESLTAVLADLAPWAAPDVVSCIAPHTAPACLSPARPLSDYSPILCLRVVLNLCSGSDPVGVFCLPSRVVQRCRRRDRGQDPKRAGAYINQAPPTYLLLALTWCCLSNCSSARSTTASCSTFCTGELVHHCPPRLCSWHA